MTRPCFIFDLNKCVGCQACIVACQIENAGRFTKPLRRVYNTNTLQVPGVPCIHLSLACNHCADPACERNCPANAYTIDKTRGIVMHHAERCIGCKYCTWVCPYDAPVFNAANGIVEKCTFCFDRMTEGLEPACAGACSTGALGFGAIDPPVNRVTGFPETGITPSIQLIPLRKPVPAAIMEPPAPAREVAEKPGGDPGSPS